VPVRENARDQLCRFRADLGGPLDHSRGCPFQIALVCLGTMLAYGCVPVRLMGSCEAIPMPL
jgi:hypothetical protein